MTQPFEDIRNSLELGRQSPSGKAGHFDIHYRDKLSLLEAVDVLMAFVKYADHDFDKCDRDALVANFLQGHSGQGEFNCVCGFYDAFDVLPPELKEALK